MLKKERINVVVDDMFTVQDMPQIEFAELADRVKTENPKLGQAKLAAIISQEGFVERVTSWGLDQECNAENKRAFHYQFGNKAAEILLDANKLIEEKKGELLGNLLTGANGD